MGSKISHGMLSALRRFEVTRVAVPSGDVAAVGSVQRQFVCGVLIRIGCCRTRRCRAGWWCRECVGEEWPCSQRGVAGGWLNAVAATLESHDLTEVLGIGWAGGARGRKHEVGLRGQGSGAGQGGSG